MMSCFFRAWTALNLLQSLTADGSLFFAMNKRKTNANRNEICNNDLTNLLTLLKEAMLIFTVTTTGCVCLNDVEETQSEKKKGGNIPEKLINHVEFLKYWTFFFQGICRNRFSSFLHCFLKCLLFFSIITELEKE